MQRLVTAAHGEVLDLREHVDNLVLLQTQEQVQHRTLAYIFNRRGACRFTLADSSVHANLQDFQILTFLSSFYRH